LVGKDSDVTVKLTWLLMSILGATTTTRGPDVAPVGTVAEMEVALQEVAGISSAFRVT
jgi:hypothetical protein